MVENGQIVHTMVRVEELEPAVEWYTDHLEYVEHGRSEADTYTLSFLGPEGADEDEDEAMLELTYNHDGRSYTMGDAWGHIAVRVDDVYDAYEKLMAEGVEDYRDPDSCGGSYAFVKDPEGHEIEIVERENGLRWGIDHTMVRVEDADEALGWYTRKLKYEETGRWESDTFANYFMKPRGAAETAMALELTYNYDGRTYTMGDAWGHLAIATPDVEEYWETLMEREAEAYRPPDSPGATFTKDPDGHELELVTR